MKSLKKIGKYIGRTLSAFAVLILLYFLSAIVLSIFSVDKEAEDKDVPDVAIYMTTNGDHVDIVVPLKNDQVDWSKEIKLKNTVANDTTAHFVAIGFGDRDFYLKCGTLDKITAGIAFRAGTGLGTPAMHTTFYEGLERSAACRKMMLTTAQYYRLIMYIEKSFKTDGAGHFINIKTDVHFGDNDAFYEANGHYNIFFTCNTWANNALKAAGQVACLWTPFDQGIFYHYKAV